MASADSHRSSIERVQIKLPTGFDPVKHQAALLKKITEMHGPGFEIDSIDPATNLATASRQAIITEVTQAKHAVDSFEVRLARGTKPTDGPKQAAKLEDSYPGYFMTRFEPFLGKATLSRLTDDEARCRGAVAVALGVQQWDVQVRARVDGGYDLDLPHNYQPSKAAKIQEVAEQVVGREGWYATVDAQKLTASIIPSDPPTFPAAIPYPVRSLTKAPRDRVALGEQLAAPGQEENDVLWLDFEAAPHTQVSGTSGSGKSVALNALITGALAGGSELCVLDLPHKAVDFFWVRDYCRDGGWGCDSLRGAVAAVTMIYQEGERRAKVLAQRGATKWTELPPREQFKPILMLIDEVTGLIQLDDVPKGISKDHPLVVEAMEANLLRQTLLGYMKKIAAEMRFVGIRMILSSQVSSVNTGIPTALRMNLANKFLLGSNPTDGNRKLSLSDPTSVPKVPENVRRDDKAARGVGVAELEGKTPSVFKSYYAATDDLRKALDTLGLPKTKRPSPTASEIARLTPSLDDDGGSNKDRDDTRRGDVSPVSGRSLDEIGREMGDPNIGWDRDGDGNKLSGFERANAARSAVVKGAKGAAPRRTPDQNNPLHSQQDEDW